MSTITKLYQCRLEQMKLYGAKVKTVWIPKRGAKVGAMVELLPDRELWKVTHVFEHGIPEDVLKEAQRQRRKPPPSIRDTKKDKRQQEESR